MTENDNNEMSEENQMPLPFNFDPKYTGIKSENEDDSVQIFPSFDFSKK